MTRGQVAVLMHDGFYCAGTGAGYANHAFLDVLARHLADDVHLHVLPVHLIRDSSEYDHAWHQRTLTVLDHHPRHQVHPVDNGTGSRVRFSGLPAFQALAGSTASTLRRTLAPGRRPVLIVGFDVPFLGVPELLPPRLARCLVTVPRSTALLHAPDDPDRIGFETRGLRATVAHGGLVGAISAHMRTHLHRDLAVPATALIDLPDGLTPTDRRFSAPRDGLLPPGGRSGFVLALGRAHPYKGWDDLLDALHLLHTGGVTLPPVLLAAVTEDQTPSTYQRHLARRITDLALPVTLRTRFDHQLRDLMAHPNLRALVVPSRREPFGRIPLEGFAAGAAPVVATTAGGLAEQVLDNVTGYTTRPNDPADLARALRRALDCDPATRSRLAAAGQELLDTRFAHERVITGFLREHAAWSLRDSARSSRTGDPTKAGHATSASAAVGASTGSPHRCRATSAAARPCAAPAGPHASTSTALSQETMTRPSSRPPSTSG